jgi:membrane protein implicated in regulation of membrane protease activity
MNMETPAVVWAIVAMVAAAIEIVTPQFGVIFISAGGIGAALVAFLGGGLVWQILTFSVVLVAGLVFLRPIMVGWLSHAPGVPSRTAPLIGKRAIVTESIDPTRGQGRVTVNGEDWAARSTSAIATGVEVRVVAADGIVLEVQP